MSQTPAFVIIARHGTRFDAAHSTWHMSTPTPYDPPLTYNGWNHCGALGLRVASLLHAREQAYNNPPQDDENDADGAGMYRRRRKKHKVVIHTSPFLRCLQTSVAIAAGMAQFEAPKEAAASKPAMSKSRTPGQLHSTSPRLRALDGAASPNLAPMSEPKHDFAHNLARKALTERKRHRKARLRVDALLGEWLNPSYFEEITPPPMSAMMVATAKAELMHHENVDIFTPAVTNKSSASSLWSGASSRAGSKNSTSEEWADVREALHASSGRRSRSNSASSMASNESSAGLKSPYRSGQFLSPLTSTVPKPQTTVYDPPTPAYAVSGTDHIPRGYVAHARSACTSVDYQWDSSRSPLEWGDGGVYGEEWTSMQRRFRKGLNNMIQWYTHHDADDRAEDALGLDQAERHHEDEEEDLVVILVTHSAGANALIGALTAQPVLLDVGMASLTMAVRRENAPPLMQFPQANGGVLQEEFEMNGHCRGSIPMDIGLSSVYEMKLVSSMEHMRPGVDVTKCSGNLIPSDSKLAQQLSRRNLSSFSSLSHFNDPLRNNTSTALGSIRRPSLNNTGTVVSAPVTPGINRRIASVVEEDFALPPSNFTTGLWTPPSARLTPQLGAQRPQEAKDALFSKLSEEAFHGSPGRDMLLDFSNSMADARPGQHADAKDESARPSLDGTAEDKKQDSVLGETEADEVSEELKSSETPPDVGRDVSHTGLWERPSSDRIARLSNEPKRRWSLMDEQHA